MIAIIQRSVLNLETLVYSSCKLVTIPGLSCFIYHHLFETARHASDASMAKCDVQEDLHYEAIAETCQPAFNVQAITAGFSEITII